MPRKPQTLQINSKYGYWKVLNPDQEKPGYSMCICTGCNITLKSIRNYDLKNQATTSCSCKNKEKIKQTNLKKFGVEFYSQSEECKRKVKKTSLERYGVEHYAQTKQSQDRYKKTCQDKYGVDNYRKSKECKEKIKTTHMKKHGVDSYAKTKQYKEQTKNTSLKKWNTTHFSKTQEFKDKVKATSLEKYGVEHYTQTEESRNKKRKNKIARSETHSLSSMECTIKEYCTQKNISYSHALLMYREHGEEAFLKYCENYTSNIYSTEQNVISLLSSFLSKPLDKYDRCPKEFKLNRKPDFRLEEKDKILYLNIDGLYWHSEKQKDNKYHLALSKSFRENNQVIYQFREDELRDKPEIVKSIVLNHLGRSSIRIFARKCIIKKVDAKDGRKFLIDNHLMGNIPAKCYGLYQKDELVAIMSVKKVKKGLDISRYCCKLNTSVIGGFSKLLKYIEKEHNPEFIQSYLDLRYSTGISYKKMGFSLEQTHLGWKWTDGQNTFNRLKCKANMDSRKLSEKEYARELGWYKIYDAGQAKYILRY